MTRSLSQSLGGGSPDQWALDFLAAAGIAPTPSNVQAVVSWEYAESAGGGGMWNPLNTTQGGYAGETDFNSVGVKNYVHREDGITANARVIHNGYYPHVLEAFARGDNARATADAITASPWGTGYIPLRGTVQQPVPPSHAPEVEEMQVIALPGNGTPAGRIRVAVWDPAHPNRIALENGARLRGDDPTPIAHVRTWTPKKLSGASAIPAGVHGIGIAAMYHGGPQGATGATGAVDRVVLVCTGGNTYIAETP